MKKFAILALTSLFLLSACASGPAKEEVQKTIDAAKAENAAAKKTGFLWRDAGKMIKKAEEALKDGDNAAAMKQAKKALFQGKQAQMQAKEQAEPSYKL
ncbi:MAG: SoxXA-binding protein [Gammaproteobacteria bacterium]|nr:SoxXA-binding protein [Gammaproteobacteria bacterium]